MHETLEELQMTSKKHIRGDLKVYFSFFTLIFILLANKISVHITAFLIFSILSIYSIGWYYLKLLKIPTYFLLPSLLIIAFFIPGKSVDMAFPFKPTKEGLTLAFHTALRAYASLSILFYMVLTTTIPEIFAALKRLKLPSFVIELSLLIYRAIQILMDELSRLDKSANSRLGYSSKRTFINTASLLGYSLFIKSLERAEKMNLAMEARCYSGKMPIMKEKSSGYGIVVGILILLTILWVIAI